MTEPVGSLRHSHTAKAASPGNQQWQTLGANDSIACENGGLSQCLLENEATHRAGTPVAHAAQYSM